VKSFTQRLLQRSSLYSHLYPPRRPTKKWRKKTAAAKKSLQTVKFAGAQRGDYRVPTTKYQVPSTDYLVTREGERDEEWEREGTTKALAQTTLFVLMRAALLPFSSYATEFGVLSLESV